MKTRTLALCLFAGTLCGRAAAQNYAIDWYKVSGGGGTSTNGQYTISGTIGQPEAGAAMTGGNYSLTGGFWSLVAAVQTPGAPTLAITLNPQLSTINITWPYPSSGWTLQQNAGVASPSGWQTSGYTISNNGVVNSITITAPTGSMFFRLAK